MFVQYNMRYIELFYDDNAQKFLQYFLEDLILGLSYLVIYPYPDKYPIRKYNFLF